jgi:hypothetical protein
MHMAILMYLSPLLQTERCELGVRNVIRAICTPTETVQVSHRFPDPTRFRATPLAARPTPFLQQTLP